MQEIATQCCIVGGGPAGMMLGHLLARAGIAVAVVEKHADFLRDFRGDTVHPSTMEILAATGELRDLLRLDHAEFETMTVRFESTDVTVADFSRLPVVAPFVMMMPQWDFLDFLARRSRARPGFRLEMRAEATGLLRDGGLVVGVEGQGRDGPFRVRAPLTVAADGRHSRLRDAAGVAVRRLGAPVDVMWFRLGRRDGDSDQALAQFSGGHIAVMLNRGDYWQIAYVVPKGGADAVRAAGLEAFRRSIGEVTGLGADRAAEISEWDAVKVLDVQVNRLERWWQDGLLFIGDAAHAMSPVGGVGINLAIQDAVAAANALVGPLRSGRVPAKVLAAIEARRLWPVRVTQGVQVAAQRMLVERLKPDAPMPLPLRLIRRVPSLSRLTARFLGLGLRREMPDQVFRGR